MGHKTQRRHTIFSRLVTCATLRQPARLARLGIVAASLVVAPSGGG